MVYVNKIFTFSCASVKFTSELKGKGVDLWLIVN